jgi:TRAP-type C4-dicarboxylate transport system permease small subunit
VEGLVKFNRRVMLAGKVVVGAIMVASVFLLFVNVILRYVFGYAISWAEEVTRYTLLWTVFIGAGVISRESSHVSMEAFFNLWPAKWQRTGFLVIHLFCIATIAVIFYFGIGITRMVIETGQTSEAAFIPMWIIYGAFPVGSVLMIFGYAETAWRQWTGNPITAHGGPPRE